MIWLNFFENNLEISEEDIRRQPGKAVVWSGGRGLKNEQSRNAPGLFKNFCTKPYQHCLAFNRYKF